MNRGFVVLLCVFLGAAVMAAGATLPVEAAYARRTPTPTPTLDLTGYFRPGQQIQWRSLTPTPTVGAGTPTPIPRAFDWLAPKVGRGGSSTQEIAFRASANLSDVAVETKTLVGEIQVLSAFPTALVVGTEYRLTLRIVRPRDRRMASGYVRIKASDRPIAPLLQVQTKPIVFGQ